MLINNLQASKSKVVKVSKTPFSSLNRERLAKIQNRKDN